MKKYLTMIAASLLVCALALSSAFASEGDSNASGSPIETAAQLASACETGGDYYLSKNIDLTSADLGDGSIHVKAAVTLNMNGKYLTLCADGANISTIPFVVDDGASLKIDRSTPTAGVGGVTQKDGTHLYCSLVRVEGSGSLTVRHNISNINVDANRSIIELTGETSAMEIDGANFAQCENSGGSIVWVAGGKLDFRSGSFDSCTCATSTGRAASPLAVGSATSQGAKATATIAQDAYFSNCSSSSETVSCGSAITVSDYGTVEFAGLIQDCTSGKYGAAVCVDMGGTFNMNSGSIKGGSSASYGAVYVGQKDAYVSMPSHYGTFTMKGGEICDDIDSAGSMIYVGYGGSFKLEKGTIPAARKATQGGCVSVDTGGKFLATGGDIKAYEEGALFKGGCIFSKGIVELYKCSVDGNGAEVTQGGLIYMAAPAAGENLSTVKIGPGARLTNGAAYDSATDEAGKGGAVYVEAGSLTIDGLGDLSDSGCVIEDCTADTAGGAVYLKSGRLEMGRDSMVRNCTAAYTDSLMQSNASHVSYGGAFYIESGDVNLQNGTIENCNTTGSGNAEHMGHGGAIYVQSFTTFTTANAFEIKACATQGNGGGICFGAEAPISRETTAHLDAVRAYGCTAANGGAIWAGNGGFYEVNLRAYQCTADECGGAAYFGGCRIALSGEVSSCTAHTCGGVYVGCAAEVAKTGQTSFKMTGKLVINSNTATDVSFGKNLFLDYRGEAFTKFAPTTTPFEVSLEGLSQDSTISLAVTDSALDYCGNGVIQLSSDGWDLRDCFTLEISGQILASHDNQQALLVVAKANQICTADEYKAAREAGGEYFLMNDLDLSKDLQGTGQFKKSFTLNFQFHWLTLEPANGVGIDIANGCTVQLGTASEGAHFEGGIRGTSDTLRTASDSYQMIRVREGGCLHLATNIQNVGNCMYPYDGSAISIDASDSNQAKAYITAGTISRFYDSNSPLISVGRGSALSLSGLTIQDTERTATSCFIKLSANSELKASNTSFTGASRSRDTSFICASFGAKAELLHCTFSGLNSTNCGCLNFDNEATATLTGCTFKDCTAKNGGAIYADSSTITTTGNTEFINCKATEKGGAICGSNATLVVSDTAFDHCSACCGGAMNLATGSLNMKDTKVHACSASDSGGAFCFATESPHEAIIERSTISECTAEKLGGGIYSTWKLTISDSTIKGCTSGGDGGAIYNAASERFELTVDATITANTAMRGGGIYVACGMASISGDINRNKAKDLGGGIALGADADACQVVLESGCTVDLNSSEGIAGGIWMPMADAFAAHLTLAGDARVVNNTAQGVASNLYLDTSSSPTCSDAIFGSSTQGCADRIDASGFSGTAGVSIDAAGVTAWPYGFASATAASSEGFVSDSADYVTSYSSEKQCAVIDRYQGNGGSSEEPSDNDDPVGPADPDDPVIPDDPVDPADPDDSDDPDADDSDNPVDPADPDDPDDPDNPTDPADSDNPAESADSNASDVAANSDDSGNTAEAKDVARASGAESGTAANNVASTGDGTHVIVLIVGAIAVIAAALVIIALVKGRKR